MTLVSYYRTVFITKNDGNLLKYNRKEVESCERFIQQFENKGLQLITDSKIVQEIELNLKFITIDIGYNPSVTDTALFKLQPR